MITTLYFGLKPQKHIFLKSELQLGIIISILISNGTTELLGKNLNIVDKISIY